MSQNCHDSIVFPFSTFAFFWIECFKFFFDWREGPVLDSQCIGQMRQSWQGLAESKCCSHGHLQTKKRNVTRVTTTGLTYTNVKVLERFHGKVAFGIEGFKQKRARTQITTYQAREDFHFVSFLLSPHFSAVFLSCSKLLVAFCGICGLVPWHASLSGLCGQTRHEQVQIAYTWKPHWHLKE